jgi:MoCo/4Fe-4S cofactor protein with predicted Tat translocation signal
MSDHISSGGPETADVTYWRSLEQLENSTEFQQLVEREFPEGITESGDDVVADDVSRRGFLTAVAASVALAGLTSCRKPVTKILPFNKRPEGFKPGTPQFYATTLSRSGYGIGVLVKSSDGRPTKIEGNPDHPSSLGTSDARLQAELLQIYDPGRSRSAKWPGMPVHDAAHDGHGHKHEPVDPNLGIQTFYSFWDAAGKALAANNGGAGLHILTEPTTSPTQLGLVEKLKSVFPQAKVYAWDALHGDEAAAGATAAFGKAVETHVDFAKANVVASFDSDFLATDGNNLRNAKTWGDRRRAPKAGEPMSRLYVFETCYTSTGTVADHRFARKAQDVTAALLQLAAELGVGAGNDLGASLNGFKSSDNRIAAIAKDLKNAGGNCAVVVGPRQPAAAHAVAHAINQALGAVGKTVTYTTLPAQLQGNVASIQSLAASIEGGQVKTLVCLGTNPVYDAPADLKFGTLLAKVETTIHVGSHADETAGLCQWHFPMAHDLESWGDVRAHDGTVSLRQPLVAPLFGGVSAIEFLSLLSQQPVAEALLTGRDGSCGMELVREQWRQSVGAAGFDAWWRNALHAGHVADSKFAAENVTLAPAGVAAAVRTFQPIAGTEVLLRACPKMWDGRYANNSWMQELPDPLTKMCWDNAALMGPAMAQKLGVAKGDMLSVRVGSAELAIPAFVLPGHADDAVTIYLGWGRKLSAEAKVAQGTGFNAYSLRTSAAQWTLSGATISKGQGNYRVVSVQEQGTMAGREIVREISAEGYSKNPNWAPQRSPLDKIAKLTQKDEKDLAKSLWTERGYQDGEKANDPIAGKSPYQWGMVIDLNACTGCSACVVACVSENNIPMVGKTQVANGRAMFWIRSDRYFASKPGSPLDVGEDPQVANMPVPCMQCENAPCESVCPVAATMHSPDGLNDMVYNRCIGTRYCANNCPYKVRRFNYFNYLGDVPDTKRMAFNPDVTPRARGVMEKCTYCVQRINGARIQAKLSGTKVGDNEGQVKVATACSQACPTQAITFGNIIDTSSNVAKLRSSGLNYGLLSELNTKPRTTYLGRVRNPNPELSQNQG